MPYLTVTSYGSVSNVAPTICFSDIFRLVSCPTVGKSDQIETTQYFLPFSFSLRNTSELYFLTSVQTLGSNTSLPRSLRLTLQANPSGIRWSVIPQSELILGWELRSTHRLITQSLGSSRAAEAHQNQRTVPFILSQIFTVWHFRWKREFSFSTNLDNPGNGLLSVLCFGSSHLGPCPVCRREERSLLGEQMFTGHPKCPLVLNEVQSVWLWLAEAINKQVVTHLTHYDRVFGSKHSQKQNSCVLVFFFFFFPLVMWGRITTS